MPRELRNDELPAIIAGFKNAAKNAKAAGFDGVEVHGANGYLLDQFLRDGSNKRTGNYGGSIENRARLLFEVIAAVLEVWDSKHVGLRLPPLNSYNSMIKSDPVALISWLAKNLNYFNLGYLHVMRADFFHSKKVMYSHLRANIYFKGLLVSNMGYTDTEVAEAISTGKLNAVAFGSSFLANPDLPARFKANAPLNALGSATFYTWDAKGYTDYPTLNI